MEEKKTKTETTSLKLNDVAFILSMGLHERVGEISPINTVSQYIIQLIIKFIGEGISISLPPFSFSDLVSVLIYLFFLWHVKIVGTLCRSAVGVCDIAGLCTGTSSACPSDTLASSIQITPIIFHTLFHQSLSSWHTLSVYQNKQVTQCADQQWTCVMLLRDVQDWVRIVRVILSWQV